MKNSFVIYHDYEDKLKMLSDEQMGKLWRMIFKYEKTGEVIDLDDAVIMMAFSFIRNDLDINRQKYETKVNNGKLGGRPKNQKKQKETKRNQTKPSKTDNDNVNVNDNVNDNVCDAWAKIIIDYLNKRTGKAFKYSKASLGPIVARLKEGYSIGQCQKVIDTKVAKWGHDAKMKDYIRPQTLFAPSHFESYLNEDVSTPYMHEEIKSEQATEEQIDDVKKMMERMKA